MHPTRGSGRCPQANTATSGGQRAQGPEAIASQQEGPTEPVAKGTRYAAIARARQAGEPTAGADVKGETTAALATSDHPWVNSDEGRRQPGPRGPSAQGSTRPSPAAVAARRSTPGPHTTRRERGP